MSNFKTDNKQTTNKQNVVTNSASLTNIRQASFYFII